MGTRRLIGASLSLLLPAGIAGAQAGHRLDFFDARSNGLGYGIIQYGRIDLYDGESNFIGSIRLQ